MFKLEAASTLDLGVLGYVAAVDLVHVYSLLFARTRQPFPENEQKFEYCLTQFWEMEKLLTC